MEKVPNVEEIQTGFKDIQNQISNFLITTCGQTYQEDCWNYEKGEGGGITRIWEGDPQTEVLEKAGVNFSGIIGQNLPVTLAAQTKIATGTPFHATGISLVIHPSNPYIPTIHMNLRYFEAGEEWWFGGGVDLTPYYPTISESIQFHKSLEMICAKHGMNFMDFKKICDDYFFLKHRNISRGIGGIFFDQIKTSNSTPFSKLQIWRFILDIGMNFTKIYEPFITLEKQRKLYSIQQREFQLIRRSHYVEFNLIYDRGTKFGLQSEGRTESILMSLPSVAKWKYNWKPQPGSEEETVFNFFLQPQDWINMSE